MKMLPAFLLLVMAAPMSWAIDAEEIIDKLDANQIHSTSEASMQMTVTGNRGLVQTSQMKTFTKGEDLTLIEFTSAAERGQKVLRTDEEVYLYFPDAAELIRLQGAALRDSLGGSDISYEDITGGKDLLDAYDITLQGIEPIDGHDSYKLELVARKKNIAYYRRMLWIDIKDFVLRYSELYALSGRLLKTLRASDFQNISGKIISMRLEVVDELKRNTKTILEISDFRIGGRLSDQIFSLDELTW